MSNDTSYLLMYLAISTASAQHIFLCTENSTYYVLRPSCIFLFSYFSLIRLRNNGRLQPKKKLCRFCSSILSRSYGEKIATNEFFVLKWSSQYLFVSLAILITKIRTSCMRIQLTLHRNYTFFTTTLATNEILHLMRLNSISIFMIPWDLNNNRRHHPFTIYTNYNLLGFFGWHARIHEQVTEFPQFVIIFVYTALMHISGWKI